MNKKNFFKGIFFTCSASIFWGLPQPLIFNAIKFIPVIEIVSHRAIWSFFFLLITILILGKVKDFFFLFKSTKLILVLSLTAILISINWICFIYAIDSSRIQDASMGYFLTPLVSIILGYIFLKEKISNLKLLSILLMFSAIIYLLISLKTIPLLAIMICTSWGIYGLIKKQLDISSEIGLLYESGFITLIALPFLIYLNFHGSGFFFKNTFNTNLLLMLTGAITVAPLFLFNFGVKYVQLGFAGVIFYLAPSLHFITSIFILNEEMNINKLISFIIIWLAIIIFIIEVIKEEKQFIESNTQ